MNPSVSPGPAERRAARVTIEIAFASIGATLALGAILANQPWLDRHFLPSWFVPHRWYVAIESSVRVLIAAAGVSLAVIARARLARVVASAPGRIMASACAAVLALGAGELVLRSVHLRAAEWLAPSEEPRRRLDPRLGWTFVPARTGQNVVGGRRIDYSFDATGYRVRRPGEPVDPSLPTLVPYDIFSNVSPAVAALKIL